MLIFDSLACSTRGADGLSWQRDIGYIPVFFPVLSWGNYGLWLDYSANLQGEPWMKIDIQLQTKFREERFL